MNKFFTRISFFFFLTFFSVQTARAINVTFRVDMTGQEPASGEVVTLNGTFNNWCGACAPMTMIGGNVWQITVELDANTSYEYKYAIGAWASQENLQPGDECTLTTGEFTNRVLLTGTGDMTLPVVCYGACSDCAGAPPRSNVTFKVDMSQYQGDLGAGVTINGTFNNWCGNCAVMVHEGDDIYALTILLDAGSYDYKFTVGSFDDQEMFNPGETCTVTTGEFTNRYLEVNSSAPITEGPYYWNSCNISGTIGFGTVNGTSVAIYPNPVRSGELTVELAGSESVNSLRVVSATGQLVLQQNGLSWRRGTIPMSDLDNGVYFIHLETASSSIVKRVVKL